MKINENMCALHIEQIESNVHVSTLCLSLRTENENPNLLNNFSKRAKKVAPL